MDGRKLLARAAALGSAVVFITSGLVSPRAYADGAPDSGKPAASAPATEKKAPVVSEQAVRKLFEDATLYGADIMSANLHKYGDHLGLDPDNRDIFKFTGNFAEWKSNFPHLVEGFDDVDKFLRERYKKATTDQARAAIVSFKALGGVDLAKEAAVDVFGAVHAVPNLYEDKPTSILDNSTPWSAGKTKYELNIGTFNAVTKKWEDKPYSDGRTPVTVTKEWAETLLGGAREHGMAFSDYMKFYLTRDFANNKIGIAIQNAAKSLGLGLQPPAATVASSARQP